MNRFVPEPLVELDRLSMHYRVQGGDRSGRLLKAVDGFSLSISPGETVGLVGESGCGKSTVGQIAARLLEPTGGRLRYNGAEMTNASSSERRTLRKQIQYVFQDPYSSLNPSFRIGRLLEEPLRFNRLDGKEERKRRVHAMLERVGLDASYARRYPHELSGGQRQRIGIARALMVDPAFLVLDEPVSALDVSVQAQILNLLKELQAERGLTYLFISHDMNVIHYMSDRVAVMYLGELVELADVDALFDGPKHPYTQALISAIPASGWRERRSASIQALGELPSALSLPPGCRFQTRCPFAHDRCRREAPALAEIGQGHAAACHLYETPGESTLQAANR
ncbi:ABC transporter ATP-binding protein [Paenibacillus xanthanilyticus]|uniref:ABC transporter ATP-binding protein n=1 Tax=Paenibacillus xanthanilyticus TaxID=1783531 RepID=A0ABV8K6E5_9BACL